MTTRFIEEEKDIGQREEGPTFRTRLISRVFIGEKSRNWVGLGRRLESQGVESKRKACTPA